MSDQKRDECHARTIKVGSIVFLKSASNVKFPGGVEIGQKGEPAMTVSEVIEGKGMIGVYYFNRDLIITHSEVPLACVFVLQE